MGTAWKEGGGQEGVQEVEYNTQPDPLHSPQYLRLNFVVYSSSPGYGELRKSKSHLGAEMDPNSRVKWTECGLVLCSIKHSRVIPQN